MADETAQLLAKDRRIDELIEQAAKLVVNLSVTVADMKAILAAANVAEQKRISEESRHDRGG